MRSARRCSAYNTDTLRESSQAVGQGSDAAFHELSRVTQKEQLEKISGVRTGPQGAFSNRRRPSWRQPTHRRVLGRNQFATWFTCQSCESRWAAEVRQEDQVRQTQWTSRHQLLLTKFYGRHEKFGGRDRPWSGSTNGDAECPQPSGSDGSPQSSNDASK